MLQTSQNRIEPKKGDEPITLKFGTAKIELGKEINIICSTEPMTLKMGGKEYLIPAGQSATIQCDPRTLAEKIKLSGPSGQAEIDAAALYRAANAEISRGKNPNLLGSTVITPSSAEGATVTQVGLKTIVQNHVSGKEHVYDAPQFYTAVKVKNSAGAAQTFTVSYQDGLDVNLPPPITRPMPPKPANSQDHNPTGSTPGSETKIQNHAGGSTVKMVDYSGFASESLLNKYYRTPLDQLLGAGRELGSNLKSAIDNIFESMKPGRGLKELTIQDHGSNYGVQFGKEQLYSTGLTPEQKTQFERLRGAFEEGGVIRLRNCRAGQHRELMQDIADATNTRVIANEGLSFGGLGMVFSVGKKVVVDPKFSG